MIDLRNTIAHILEHSQHLVEANEATTQQYVVLPILRALGWEDDNLASMEILPEHSVEKGYVDYALKVERKLVLFVECKRWSEPLEGHESQITNYAFNAGAPIAVLTNGKIWHFYFSWVEGTSVSERIFCEIDIEDQENTISDLKKYLLKSNVASGEAELNAKIALGERQKTAPFESEQVDSKIDLTNDIKEVAKSTKVKAREKKPSISERYVSDTTEEDRNDIAVKVVEMRINSSGSKGMSWRRIREKLGLKNDQFHKVIRPSDGYREAVVARIKSLKAQEGGWEYSGKLKVLTGIKITESELE